MAGRDRLPVGAVAWSLFEGARNPFVVLVTIYVFMPYFSSVVVGNPIRGQQLVATYGQWSGLIVAVTAPFLGAGVDRIGRRKPMLLLVTGLMVPLIASLWWTRADHRGLSVEAVIVIAASINILFAYSEVLHNSMLVRAAGVAHAHAASGLALALGNLVSVSVLVFVLWAFVLPAVVPGFVPHAPLFGLDPRRYEPSRIVAPISAAILALGAIPLFLLTPDAPATGLRFGRALAEGARSLRTMLSRLKGHRDAKVFLVSRMLYIDAMTGVLLFSGVYAAGVMHWAALQLLAYGVLLSLSAVAGGLSGGVLDHVLGPKRAVQIEIGVTSLGLLALIGIAPDRIFYFWHVAPGRPVWNGPIFHSAPELVYVALAAILSVFITASYASSRTLLTRLTPAEETGAFFGLYALSGTATVWIGSALVLVATHVTQTQQAGFIALAALMMLGFLGLLFVQGGGRDLAAPPRSLAEVEPGASAPVPSIGSAPL